MNVKNFLVTFLILFLGLLPSVFSAAESGEKLYQNKGCAGCHTIGKGVLAGPDLKDVSKRRTKEWLVSWLKNPDALFEKKDPIAMKMLGTFFTKMPNLALTDEDISKLLDYINHESEKSINKKEGEKHEHSK